VERQHVDGEYFKRAARDDPVCIPILISILIVVTEYRKISPPMSPQLTCPSDGPAGDRTCITISLYNLQWRELRHRISFVLHFHMRTV
jgi:hypothetical protein